LTSSTVHGPSEQLSVDLFGRGGGIEVNSVERKPLNPLSLVLALR